MFEGLSIWESEKYRRLQGTYPVLFLSFANVKEQDFANAREKICMLIQELYAQYDFLFSRDRLKEGEKEYVDRISLNMSDAVASHSLRTLSRHLYQHYGKKVLLILDEYDTPMQEAYVNGYWEALTGFLCGLFHASFKTNPYLEWAIMTGITRISKESIFSDLNHLEGVTTTSEKYETSFGFTRQEVWDALEEYGLLEQKQLVRDWYDGFTFGRKRKIYNSWSILNYLDKKRLSAYWANTSSNHLVEKVIREGSITIKQIMEELLEGKPFHTRIDEQLVFGQ